MLKSIAIPAAAHHSLRDSNDNSPYYVASNSFDLEACGRRGSARVTARVAGYWSADVITLYVERRSYWSDASHDALWQVTMSHSSGGRLTAVDDTHYKAEHGYVGVDSDLIAEAYFGQALIGMATWGDELLNYTEALEHWYQVERAERKAAEEVTKAEYQAAKDADIPLGTAAAKMIVDEARRLLSTEHHPSVLIECYERGLETFFNAVASKQQFITWTYAGQRMSEENIIKQLAGMSHRTDIII